MWKQLSFVRRGIINNDNSKWRRTNYRIPNLYGAYFHQDIISSLQELDLNIWYLYDGTIACPPDNVSKALSIMKSYNEFLLGSPLTETALIICLDKKTI